MSYGPERAAVRDGVCVMVNGDLHRALGKLKRQSNSIIAELRRRRFYLKPGEARRLKARKARKRARKAAERNGLA